MWSQLSQLAEQVKAEATKSNLFDLDALQKEEAASTLETHEDAPATLYAQHQQNLKKAASPTPTPKRTPLPTTPASPFDDDLNSFIKAPLSPLAKKVSPAAANKPKLVMPVLTAPVVAPINSLEDEADVQATPLSLSPFNKTKTKMQELRESKERELKLKQDAFAALSVSVPTPAPFPILHPESASPPALPSNPPPLPSSPSPSPPQSPIIPQKDESPASPLISSQTPVEKEGVEIEEMKSNDDKPPSLTPMPTPLTSISPPSPSSSPPTPPPPSSSSSSPPPPSQVQNFTDENTLLRRQVDSAGDQLVNMSESYKALQVKAKNRHADQANRIHNLTKQIETMNLETKTSTSSSSTKLLAAEADLSDKIKDFDTLKEKAKTIALELRERREECKNYNIKLAASVESNNALSLRQMEGESMVKSLRSKNEILEEKITATDQSLSLAQSQLEASNAGGSAKTVELTSTFAAYKKKAQAALASANSRSNDAVQLSLDAESRVKEATDRMEEAESFVAAAEVKAAQAFEALKSAEDFKIEKKVLEEKLRVAVTNAAEAEKMRARDVEESDTKLEAAETKISEVVDDALKADEESALQREKDEATINKLNGGTVQLTEKIKELTSALTRNTKKANANANANATVDLDLETANEKIAMLEQRLEAAAAAAAAASRRAAVPRVSSGIVLNEDQEGKQEKDHQQPSTPLFYALEKQNELKIAREEISRLASLIGDIASQKADFQEQCEELRETLQVTEAKLKRGERMGDKEGSAINIEYLKNVVLQFIAAETSVDKNALLPVVSMVLSLTDAEKQRAQNAINVGVFRGVGNSLVDGVSNSKAKGGGGGGFLAGFLSPSKPSSSGVSSRWP